MQDLCSFLFQESLRFLQADAVVSNGTQMERYAPTAVWNVKGFFLLFTTMTILFFFLFLVRVSKRRRVLTGHPTSDESAVKLPVRPTVGAHPTTALLTLEHAACL